MNRKLLTIGLLALPFICNGQEKLLKTVPINGPVAFAGVDRPGDLYVVMKDGWVRKYDGNGNEIATKKFESAPTLFEPGDGTRVFAYFRKGQKFQYLNPDMSESDERVVNPEFAISPWLVCPSRNELWILDSADMSLKKTSGRGTAIAYDVPWTMHKPKSVGPITYMREYLNFLFVLRQDSGIYQFNTLGKLINHVSAPKLQWFNLYGEELYYSVNSNESSRLHFIDLYTKETRDSKTKDIQHAFLTEERFFIVTTTGIEFYELAKDGALAMPPRK
jgi:hypothetical protein